MSNASSLHRDIDEWEIHLGSQIRELRIRKRMNQEDLAKQANISLSAIRGMETGKGSSLATLIKVVRALDKLEWLEALAPPVAISPMQLLKRGKKTPQRYYNPQHPPAETES